MTILLQLLGMQKTEVLLKKRLNDLKKLSQNLKQSSQGSKQMDLTLIKAIFDMTKTNQNLYQSSSSRKIVDQSQSFSSLNLPILSKVTKKSSSFLAEKYATQPNEYLLNEENIEPLFPDKSRIKSIPSSPKISGDNLPGDQQLIQLHQYNCKLEFELREMRQKLKEYQARQQQRLNRSTPDGQMNQKQSQSESCETKGSSSYFRLEDKVELFYTKLSIDKTDYNKVQHQLLPLKLTLDKLAIRKDRLSSSKVSRGSKTLSGMESNNVDLHLKYLRQVQYDGDTNMIITFAQNQQSSKSKLFLKFDSLDNMRRWDIAIYINNKIILNLFSEKIFQKEKEARLAQIQQREQEKQQRVSNSHSHSRSLFSKEQNYENLNEKQLIIRLTYYKEKFTDAQKKLKEIMTSKINENKKENGAQSKVEENQKSLDKIQLNQYFNISMGNLPKSKLQEEQILYPSLSRVEDVQKQRQRKERQNKEKQMEQQRIRKLELEKEKQKQKQKIEAAVNFLKKGIFMTKYSKSAYKPHEKRVFINIDELKFCWEDKDSKEIKSISISDIESIEQGQIGEGIKKHVSEKKLKNKNLFLLINTKLKDRKILEFGAGNLDLLKRFIENYLIFYREVQKGNFNSKA